MGLNHITFSPLYSTMNGFTHSALSLVFFYPRANAETGAAESNKWSAERFFLPAYAHLFDIWPAVEHKVKQGEPTAQ